MNEEALQALFDALEEKYELGTLQEFKDYLNDDSKRELFFNEVIQPTYDVESLDIFEEVYGLKKKDDSEFTSPEEVTESATEVVEEPGISAPSSPEIPEETVEETPPPVESTEVVEEEVIEETPPPITASAAALLEDEEVTTDDDFGYIDLDSDNQYIAQGEQDADVDNFPGILGLFDYEEWGDFADDAVKTVQNALDRGGTVNEALSLLASGASSEDIDIENFMQVLEDLEDGKYVREEKEWNEAKERWGGGALGWLMAYYENPTRAPLALIQSITQLANKASLTAAGGTIGAYTTTGGLTAGAPGAAAGFLSSLPWAYGAASATLETGLTFAELLEEQVKENGDEWNIEGIRKVLNNPEQLNNLRLRSAGRGAVIGLIDKYTGKVGGKMVAKALKTPGKTTLKEKAKVLAKAEAVGSVGGGVGEVAGMTVAGQEYDVAEILDEMFLGTQGTAVSIASEVGLRKLKPAVYKLNSKGQDGVVSEETMIEFLRTATDEEVADAGITIENNKALKKIAEDRKNKAQKDAIVKSQFSELGITDEQTIKELTSLEHEAARLKGKDTRAAKRRLTEVNNKIDEILDNQKPQTTEEVEVTREEAKKDLEADNKLVELAKEKGFPAGETVLLSEENIEKRRQELNNQKQESNITEETTTEDVEVTEDNSETSEVPIPIRNRPKTKEESNTALTGIEAEAGEKLVEKLVQDGIKKGQTLAELQDRILRRFGWNANESQSVIEFIQGKMDGVITNDFATWRKGIKKNNQQTKQDAIQEQSTETLDVQEPTQDGRQVGERDIQSELTGESQIETETDIDTQTQEEVTPVEPVTLTQVDETVSINTTQQPPKQKNKSVEIIKQKAVGAGKAIKSLIPDIKIVLHENAQDFATQAKDNAKNKGAYDSATNTIHINLEAADLTTVAHETFHAILINKLKTDKATQRVTQRMMESLSKGLPKDSELRKKIDKFAAKYESNLQNEEKLAALIGELSANYNQLTVPQKNLIQRWVEKIAQSLGFKQDIESLTKTDTDVLNLLNTISKKVRSGEVITQEDVSVLEEGTQLTLFEGGQEVDNPANALRQQKVGDFDINYTEDKNIAEYIKEELITEPKNILDVFKGLDISNVEVLVHSPDDMLAGEIKYKGETIFEGSGGVFFVTKFGDVWASTEDAANQIVKGLNKQIDEQGRAFMLLAKGTDQKLMSSAAGVDGAMKVIDLMLKNNIFSASEFRAAVSKAVSKEQARLTTKAKKENKPAPKFKPFQLRKSAKDIMSDITVLFSDENSGTFETRGNIVKGIGNALASAKLTPEQQLRAAEFLGGDTTRRVGVSSTVQKKTGKALSQGLSDLIALVLAENLTKGLKTGDIYGVIEVNQKVKTKKSTHPSYDTTIVTEDGKPPVLHLPKNRQPGKEVLIPNFGEYKNSSYKPGQVPTLTGQINLEKKSTDKVAEKTPVKRQQKGETTTVEKLSSFYRMDKKGFIDPKDVYDSNDLRSWAKKVGYYVDVSRGDIGEITKYYLRDKQTDKKFTPKVTKRQQKGDTTAYERMMGEVENIISKSEKRGVKFNKISENVIEYIKGSKVYEKATDIQREDLLRDARARFGLKDKPSVTMNKLFDKLKNVKKITLSDKTLLYQRLRDLNRGAKTAKAAWSKASKELAQSTKELVAGGKISAKQASAVINKFSKVNMFNEASVNSFIDYMGKVFADAEYSSKMAFANKKRKQAKKNIFTKLGKADGLLGSLNRLLSVNPTMIPDSVLNKYLEVVEMFGERAAVLTLEDKSKSIKDVQSILDALDVEQSKSEELALILADSNNKVYNEDGTINYADTVKKMLDEGEIIPEYADLMRKYKKDITPQLEDTQQTDAELDQEQEELIKRFDNITIDKNSLPTREQNALARRLDKLINTVALDQLNITQLKNLLKVVDNINNGYLPHYAQLLVENMGSLNKGETLSDAIPKAAPSFFTKAYAKVKSLFTSKDKDAYTEMIRRNPTYYIDQVFGNYKGKQIYNALFDAMAKGQASFEKAFSTVQQRLDRAHTKVEKSFRSNMNKVTKSKFKQTAYMVQLEFESNPESNQVNPAADYIKATIKAMRDGKTEYTERDAQVLEDILQEFADAEGNIDLDKLYNSFNPAEKNSIKVIQDINKEMLPKAEYTSGVIRGDKINPLDNYVHLNVITDPTEATSGTDNVTQFSDSLKPSTKAKSLISRTGKVAPINFDIYSSVARGAKFVLLDYFMTEPIRTGRRTLKRAESNLEKQSKNGIMPKEQRKVFNAIANAFNESVEGDLNSAFTENSLMDQVIDYLKRTGYYTMLAGTGRFAGELLANLSYAVFVNPQALTTAVKFTPFIMSADAVKAMDNVSSTQTNRMFSGDKLTGRMVDTNILNQSIGKEGGKTKGIIANRLQQIYNLSIKKYANFVDLTANALISSPDKMIMKPIWFGSFANAFKEAAGVEVDFDKIAKNDEAYMTKYADAIKKAQVTADSNSIQAGATTNPYQTFLKGKTAKNQSVPTKAFNLFNNFMQNFLIFEYMTARTGINAAIGNGMVSKMQGVRLIAGVTSRMVLYTLLVKIMGSGLIGLLTDDEEEDEKSMDKQVGQAILSAFSTLLLGRDFGNATKSLINMGVENFNEKNLDMLRDGEYDPYKDALQYTITTGRREYKGYDLGKIMVNFFGPYTPAAKTLSFGVNKLVESPRKTKAARERQEREINERIPLEVLGNLGLIPLYKDVRKEVIKSIYKDINKKPSKGLSDKELKEMNPALYKQLQRNKRNMPKPPKAPKAPKAPKFR